MEGALLALKMGEEAMDEECGKLLETRKVKERLSPVASSVRGLIFAQGARVGLCDEGSILSH